MSGEAEIDDSKLIALQEPLGDCIPLGDLDLYKIMCITSSPD